MDERRCVFLFAAFIALILKTRCEDNGLTYLIIIINNGIEGEIELRVAHNNSGEGTDLDWDLHCFQRKNYYEKTGDVIINVNKSREDTVANGLDYWTTFKLHVQKEGYLRCESNYNSKQDLKSNTEFFFSKNKLVSVIKLNRTLALHELQGEGKLFKVLQLSKDKTVFHLTSENTTSHESILQKLQNILQNKSVAVEYIRSAGACPPNEKFKLPATELPFNASLAMDIEKFCEGNFYTGAYWNEKVLKNLDSGQIQEMLRSQQVKKIDYSALDSKDIIQEFSKTLEGLSYLKQEDVKTIANSFNLLLLADKNILQEDEQNSSNRLLEKLDILLANTLLVSKEKRVQVEQENFAVRVEDFKETGTTGVFVWDHTTTEEGTRLQMESLNKTHKVENIFDSLPRVGIQLPTSLLEDSTTSSRLVFTVFRETGPLFDRSNLTSTIISATLGGVHVKDLQEPVILHFMRNITINPEPGLCAFWDFEAKNETGDWSYKGCELSNSIQIAGFLYLDECHCNHLTHFGQIFKTTENKKLLNVEDETNLERISLIGCIVSLVSLCGVFATALISKKWLRGPGQKILLQMAINLALLLIMYLVAAYSKAQGTGCMIIGFFLHYTILSNFLWMAVAGYLQYYRLVRVFSSRTTKLVLKSAIVGWVVPVIPGVVLLSTEQYKSETRFCLPNKEWILYATIIAPVCIVLVFNIAIFIMIVKNLYMTTRPRQHVDKCISIRRFKQLAFLFTLLGLNWIFGVCQIAFPDSSVFFAYLFCITITFQGMTYFVFFVLHETVRDYWKLLIFYFRKIKSNVDAEGNKMDTVIESVSQSK